jgi:hypothetical protein
VSEVKDTNPKDAIGVKKVSTSVIPGSAIFHLGTAMMDGAGKYGPYNWRKGPVKSSVYIDAAERHMRLWFEGEERAKDSGVHHLAHAMGCMAILLDAWEHGMLTDDRPAPGQLGSVLDWLNGMVKAKAEGVNEVPQPAGAPRQDVFPAAKQAPASQGAALGPKWRDFVKEMQAIPTVKPMSQVQSEIQAQKPDWVYRPSGRYDR